MILYIFGILTINSFMNSCGKKGGPEYRFSDSNSYVSTEYHGIIDEYSNNSNIVNNYPNIINEFSEYLYNTISDISFKNNRTILDYRSRDIIKSFYKIFKKNPNTKIIITGYGCELGDKNYNLNLGRNRALTVKNYLELLGIESSRITIKTIGNKIFDNSVCLSNLDRRVEIILKD